MEPSTLARDVDAILEQYRGYVDPEIARVLDAQGRVGTLYDMMRYHLGWTNESFQPTIRSPGKRFRPAMCLLVCEALGGSREVALPAAAAIELVHNFSLIHDDIEDKDEVRRGMPTVWKVWGVDQAINAGDGMHGLANWAALGLEPRGVPPDKALAVIRAIDAAVLRLCEGQYLDLSNEGRDATIDEYLEVIRRKTAALIEASTHTGAILGTDDRGAWERFARFGQTLGLAFQIRDDVLGVFSPEKLGKQGAGDILRRKRNLPYLHALANSPRADRLREIYGHEPTPSEVTEVLEVFRASGSEAFCTEMAAKHEAEAFRILHGFASGTPAYARLLKVAQFLVWRDR
jgi:geranylgeranyl diphosphate synthase type I